MASFKWGVPAIGLAAGLGGGLVAVATLRRRTAKRRAKRAQLRPEDKRRRIDVVAIDEAARHLEGKERE